MQVKQENLTYILVLVKKLALSLLLFWLKWDIVFYGTLLYNKTLCNEITNKKMSKSISISDELYTITKKSADSEHRTVPKQLEHWVKLARIAETAKNNPDMPIHFIEELLEVLDEEEKNGLKNYTEYKPGQLWGQSK